MLETLSRYGAQAAIASGILSVIGTIFLVAFFVVEAPAILESGNTEQWVPLGRTNDALIGLTALAAIPLATRLHLSWRGREEGISGMVFAIAVVALLGTGVTQLFYAANVISSATQTMLIGPLFAGTGVWVLAVNAGRAVPSLHGGLRFVGIVAGVGYGLLLVTTLGYATSGSSDPAVAFQNPVFAVAAGLGLLGAYVGYPAWAIWLGRSLLHGPVDEVGEAPARQAA
jgi:hypothetical protein